MRCTKPPYRYRKKFYWAIAVDGQDWDSSQGDVLEAVKRVATGAIKIADASHLGTRVIFTRDAQEASLHFDCREFLKERGVKDPATRAVWCV